MPWKVLCIVYAEDFAVPCADEVRHFSHYPKGGRMVSTWIHTCGSSRTKGSRQATKRGDPIVKNDSLMEEGYMSTHSEILKGSPFLILTTYLDIS